ncbi:hypothetical protein SEVIR_8G218493v4 [Setaria viridis]
MAVIGAPTPHPVLACTCDDSGARRWRSPVSEVWTTAPSAPLHAGGETAGEAVPVTSSSSVVAALRATRGGERPDQKRNLVRARADDWQAPGVDDISFTLDGDPVSPLRAYVASPPERRYCSPRPMASNGGSRRRKQSPGQRVAGGPG